MAARLAGLVHKARAAAEPALTKLSSETAKQYESVMAKNAGGWMGGGRWSEAVPLPYPFSV
jgi:exopolysaccharide biosynthesis protein